VAFSRLFGTPVDWGLASEPAAGFAGRRLMMPRGKMLGGSSGMNAMIYIRGHRLDYDGWVAAGCAGWGYDDVLPWFLRAENQSRGASDYHGVDGPLRVTDLSRLQPLTEAFLAAAEDARFPSNPDFNGPSQEGFGPYQVTQYRDRRWSAADAYLKPVMRRPNLVVRTGAEVRRVLFEGSRAIGVEYRRNGRLSSVRARRATVLAAGAIASPHLLLLSGVGPAAELESLEIPVVLDLPGVGRNLQDHPVVPVGFHTRGVETLRRARSPISIARYFLGRGGPLASNVAEAGGFLRTRSELPAPDLQFHFAPTVFKEHRMLNEAEGFTLGVTLVAPRSRGRLSLVSRQPEHAPAIEVGQLTEQPDVDVLIEGVRIARQLAARGPLGRFVAREYQPGADVDTPPAVEDFIRSAAELLYHPVGTCKMGVDSEAVVDPSLRVHGLEGLRVVDASVMPVIVRGNTHAPTVMIAERASELIENG